MLGFLPQKGIKSNDTILDLQEMKSDFNSKMLNFNMGLIRDSDNQPLLVSQYTCLRQLG